MSGSYGGVLYDFLCIGEGSPFTIIFTTFSPIVAMELYNSAGLATPKTYSYVVKDSKQDELPSVCKWRERQEYFLKHEVNSSPKLVDLR